jgi:O-acetyl-ADP-ribose deacetylase (regulator of RNase III)
MNKHIIIPTGTVIETGAGNLRSKNIIHTVGPDMNDLSQSGLNKDSLLRFAANNFLLKANMLGSESLSVPAISCGCHAFSKKQCAKILMQSVIDF